MGNLTARNRWNGVLGKATGNKDSAHNYAIEIDTANRVNCVIGNGVASDIARSVTALQAQRFYHVACIWDGLELRLYLDAILNKSVPQTITPAANGGPLVIGQYGGNVDYLKGVVDEVRIFNIAVTQANLQLDMNAAVQSTPDTVPPSVSMTSPLNNATVSGNIALIADAADDRALVGVRFFVDGIPVGVEDTTSPFSITWQTTGVINGPHSLSATARDATGNTTTSSVRLATVANPPRLVITEPMNGGAISGSTLNVVDTVVGDTTGFHVDHVHFQVDGGAEIMDFPPIDRSKESRHDRPRLAHTHRISGPFRPYKDRRQ